MPSPRTTSERTALVVYLSLCLASIALLGLGPVVGGMLLSRMAAALYLPFRGMSVAAGHALSFLAERRELELDSAELKRTRTMVQELRQENERLRSQLDFGRRDSLHLRPGWVLARRTDRLGTRVLINRGAAIDQ